MSLLEHWRDCGGELQLHEDRYKRGDGLWLVCEDCGCELVEAADDALFAAFVAGFEASGEGFNGEYVGRRHRGEGALEAYLRRWYFPAWREGREVDYAAMLDADRDQD